MIITSNETFVAAKREAIYLFLQDAQNYYHLMPQDKIADWKATETECSFKVQGGFVITLLLDGGKEPSNVYLKSGGKSPFPFKLDIQLSENVEETKGQIVFDGEVNMFLKMMVEKPLTALFNVMSINLKKYFEQGIEG
jgi:carbon monoxide dehydrogenase subunit G